MALVLNDEQALIAKTATDFTRDRSPVSRFRDLRDRDEPLGFSRSLYGEMAALGWPGIPFDEEFDGAGLGLTELVLVVEALGRTLAPEPFIGCVGLAGSALALSKDNEHNDVWLKGICRGSKVVALAHQEVPSRYDCLKVETSAKAQEDGFVLNGRKMQVLDAVGADAFIVPAREAGEIPHKDPGLGMSLFLIEAGTPGMTVERQVRIDHRNSAILHLDNVRCEAFQIVGRKGEGAKVLEQALEHATVILCAEMLGGMSEAFSLTLDYMKGREQFGVPIGSFQALKHRAARVFIEIELARSSVMAAARAVDQKSEEAPKLVSLAKARCSDAYILTTNEAVQIFAGMGVTDECDIGLYMKRARASELTFGDADFHRARWATLSGY